MGVINAGALRSVKWQEKGKLKSNEKVVVIQAWLWLAFRSSASRRQHSVPALEPEKLFFELLFADP